MPIEILMPALSPTMKEGNLARWLKKEGDKIAAGDVIAEIETDKATMEVEAVDEGIMGKIIVADGTENVAINSLIALILEDGEDKSALDSYQPEAITPPPIAVNNDNSNNNQDKIFKNEQAAATKAEVNKKESSMTTSIINNNINISNTNSTNHQKIKASPLAKRIANEQNVNLASITGTGPHGRIIKDDITKFIKSGQNSSFFTPIAINRNQQEYQVVKNNNVRKIIAGRLLEAKQTIPHFYLSLDLKIDKLLELRKDLNAAAVVDSNDKPAYKISVNDLVIKAAALALKAVPAANSSWSDDAILIYNNIDISIAVAITEGLITPIVKNADQKSIIAISAEMKQLIEKAKDNKLQPEEFQGGGFSISNLGMYGINNFNAIVNPPQSCILAVGAGMQKPIIQDGQIKVATIMNVTLSCDHRSVDGTVGSQFLQSLKDTIENPITMLIS